MSYLEKVFSKPAQLPTLPANVVELARLTQDEDAGARHVARTLGKDQTMSAKLLRLANAASYGAGGKVESLEQAINLVGLTDFRVLVLASGALTATAKAPGLDLSAHWTHGHLTAKLAAAITKRLGHQEGNAYLVGLLHTIGIPLMHIADPVQATAVANQSAGMDYASRAQVERELLGVDHAEIGAELLRRWRLPAKITNRVKEYPDAIANDGSTESIARVASAAAHSLQNGNSVQTVWDELQSLYGLQEDGAAILETCLRESEAESKAAVLGKA